MVSDAEQLMNHILALKVKAILHNSERSEHNVMHLRSRFESQDANNRRVLEESLASLSEAIDDIDAHLAASVEQSFPA
jgi:hypothetical protein